MHQTPPPIDLKQGAARANDTSELLRKLFTNTEIATSVGEKIIFTILFSPPQRTFKSNHCCSLIKGAISSRSTGHGIGVLVLD